MATVTTVVLLRVCIERPPFNLVYLMGLIGLRTLYRMFGRIVNLVAEFVIAPNAHYPKLNFVRGFFGYASLIVAEIIKRLYVGDDAAYERLKDAPGWSFLRCCKDGPGG